SQMVFTVPPSDTPSFVVIAPAIKVTIEDQSNNILTADSSTQITMSIASNPTGGALYGTVTKKASSGVATFSDLYIDKAVTGDTPGTVHVTMVDTNGNTNDSATANSLYSFGPQVTKITPNYGPAAGGGGKKGVSIGGANFNNVTAIKLVELNKTLIAGTDFTV